MAEHGYAGTILKVDLSDGRTARLDTSEYADRFLGGRGIAAKIYWDETSPETGAYEPDNCLIFITGPLAGFTRFAGCRWQICGKSAAMDPESFSYANLGGSWGAWLKYAGYDGMVVKGRADRPVYILIDNGRFEINDASFLWGKTTIETEEALRAKFGKGVRVLAIGPAGENLVSFSNVLAAERASGSSGFGGVMGSKKLKAIAVRADNKVRPVAAEPEKLRSLADRVYHLRAHNFEDYGHILPLKTQFKACYGCISGCTRGYYEAEGGRQFKSLCQSSEFYAGAAMRYYGGDEGAEATRVASRLCDKYGLDTVVLQPLIEWLGQCYRQGIMSDEETGLPLSRIGSIEFIETLTRMISYREGFGDILSQGTTKAAEYTGKNSGKFLNLLIANRANESQDHDPRMMVANAMINATEPRRAIHLLHATALPVARWANWRQGYQDAFLSTEIFRDIAAKYWGSTSAGDLSSDKGKALASKMIQDYGYIKESLIVCDLAWPIYQVRDIDESIGLSTLESQIVSAITGRHLDEKELLKTGERNFNLQRAVLLRQGWGGRSGDSLSDYVFEEPLRWVFYSPGCLVPGRGDEPASREGSVLTKDEFERLKDEYYELRGWDVESGLPKETGLKELGLSDIASELATYGLLR